MNARVSGYIEIESGKKLQINSFYLQLQKGQEIVKNRAFTEFWSRKVNDVVSLMEVEETRI